MSNQNNGDKSDIVDGEIPASFWHGEYLAEF